VENEFEGIDEEVKTRNDDDANNKTNIGTDIDDIDLIGGILTSGDGTSSMPYTKALITDPEKLKPVRMHVTIKNAKADNEHDALDAMEDPESPYYEINETGTKQKFSTQSTKAIEVFWQKYHTKWEDFNDEVQTITPEFTKALDHFIAKSFARWKWSSDKDHKADIKEWADRMKQKDCSKEKSYIKRLIKGMKEERAHFTSQFTNEFIFTRPTMVRGLRYAKEINSFCARLVYCEIDKKNPAKLVDSRKEFNYVVAEEEIKVEEEWVRNEYEKEVVQHVINMNQSNNWVDNGVHSMHCRAQQVMYWTMRRWQKRLGARISRTSGEGDCWGFPNFQRLIWQVI
jgi:hypothetical protein